MTLDRDALSEKYGFVLTDYQYALLLEEADDLEYGESLEELVDEVMTNIVSYEKEHRWWDSYVASQS